MQPKQRERLVALAAQVAVERDPAKFRILIIDLRRMLDEKPAPKDGNPANCYELILLR
jgi:hypothetical protein